METTTGPEDHIADEAEGRESSGVGPGASASSSGGAAGPQQKGAISDAEVAQSSSFNLDFEYSQVGENCRTQTVTSIIHGFCRRNKRPDITSQTHVWNTAADLFSRVAVRRATFNIESSLPVGIIGQISAGYNIIIAGERDAIHDSVEHNRVCVVSGHGYIPPDTT
jgi:hypothetical protein